MKGILFFLGVFFLTTNPSYAQLTDEQFESILKHEDIAILNEDMKVSFVGQKADYIQIVVEKEIEYQIINEDGNKFLETFILPLRFDEVYMPHNSSVRNEIRLFDDVEISDFEAAIIHSDGSSEIIKAKKNIREHKVVTESERFGKIYSHEYSFQKLAAGEILKIKFKYSFPFKYNYERLFSTRVFMDTKIPRKKYDLKWSHHYFLEVDTSYINGAAPIVDTIDNHIVYTWHYENQPGSLDEPGSRAHTEVPWFSFTPKPYEFLYEHYNSFKEEFVPFWYLLSFNRETRIRSAIVDYQVGAKDKDNLKFEKIANKYIGMTPDDTLRLTRLRYFQRFIIDSTVYDNAYKLFNREEEYKRDHAGLELYGGVIKEPYKEFIYASLLPKLGNFFFTAYSSDSRSGYISQQYYAPMLDNEFMFASVLNNNSLAYTMPKSDKRNLYCEELPFYYENAPVMLLFTYDFAGYKRNFSEVLRVLTLPGSTAKDNCRKVNCMAKVNISNGEINFNTRISLAGQYSTLTRFSYNGGPIDSTINPIYHNKVWELGSVCSIDKVEVGNTECFYPFKTSINANYSHAGLISTKGDNIEVDLSGWIMHPVFENFNGENRYTDFYSDFPGSDTYSYMIEFDEAVSIVQSPENIQFDNNFGTYEFSIKQIDDHKLLINSYYLVKSFVVKKENISQVSTIFNAIEKNKQSKLVLKVKDD